MTHFRGRQAGWLAGLIDRNSAQGSRAVPQRPVNRCLWKSSGALASHRTLQEHLVHERHRLNGAGIAGGPRPARRPHHHVGRACRQQRAAGGGGGGSGPT